MTTHSSRPVTVWVAVGILLVLAFLSCVGGYLFNLSGADELSEYVIGSVFVILGGVYLACALRLPSGNETWRVVALVAAAVHGVFNAVVKVGIERETSSLMFVVLTAALITVLVLPQNRAYFETRRPALT